MIQQDVKLPDNIKVGDLVRLVSIPNWLIHDLPEEDQQQIMSFKGLILKVVEIDKFGYYWLECESYFDEKSRAYSPGAGFCVLPENIELISES